LTAKLLFKNQNYDKAIEFCRRTEESGKKTDLNARRTCEAHYTKGLCYLNLKIKDKAYESMKAARKLVEHIKEPRESYEFKDLIDDWFINYK